MFIRVNKNTNEVDTSLIVSNPLLHPETVLLLGWEWIDTNDSWYVNYELSQLQLENELNQLEFELKAETLELPEKELIAYLLNKINSQNEIIDNLLIEVLNV